MAESRIDGAPNDGATSSWVTDAQKRHAQKVPPGYKDADKGEPDCWGDFFGWREMIEIAKREKKSLMFVTGDAKEDWWWRSGGETVGPRRELVAEFARDAGTTFYMYSTNRFVELASKHLKRELPEKAVKELAETRESVAESREKATTPANLVELDPLNDPPKGAASTDEKFSPEKSDVEKSSVPHPRDE